MTETQAPFREITVAELRAKQPRPFLLDVRQPEEFAESHIDGAVLIPLGELPTRFQELDKNADIVVNCKGGGRSARACTFLAAQGFKRLSNLTGGNDAWQASLGR